MSFGGNFGLQCICPTHWRLETGQPCWQSWGCLMEYALITVRWASRAGTAPSGLGRWHWDDFRGRKQQETLPWTFAEWSLPSFPGLILQIKFRFSIHVYGSGYVHVNAGVDRGQKRAAKPPTTGATGSYCVSHGVWEQNPGPLEEQPMVVFTVVHVCSLAVINCAQWLSFQWIL